MGKTHLARRLCEVLPDSVCAKLGHGSPKADGRPHFFRTAAELQEFIDHRRRRCRHVVVESNNASVRRDADVVIYLAPPAGRKTNIRADAESLRQAAGVRIEPAASRRQWARALEGVLAEPDLLREVLDVLDEQAVFATDPARGAQPCPTVAARTKLWLEKDGKHSVGRGLAALLEGVDTGGSLTSAAAGAGMSYRYAWQLVHQAEANLGESMLVARSGGRRGGGSSLSAAGRKLLNVFEKLDAEVAAFASRRLASLIQETSEDE